MSVLSHFHEEVRSSRPTDAEVCVPLIYNHAGFGMYTFRCYVMNSCAPPPPPCFLRFFIFFICGVFSFLSFVCMFFCVFFLVLYRLRQGAVSNFRRYLCTYCIHRRVLGSPPPPPPAHTHTYYGMFKGDILIEVCLF